MLSGPDLGAGFLYQLSFDGEPPGPSFTFHAQDGGVDAAGPPIGPPTFLGYSHPPTPCMFGGPRCWERRFQLPESELVRARAAYQRTRFCMGALLGHEYEGLPVPFVEGFGEFLERCDAPLRAAGRHYAVVGRGAAWLRSAGEPPGRLAVATDAQGAELIGRALEAWLLEPVADRGAEEGFGGRAFLGTFQRGLRVDFGTPPPGAGRSDAPTEELDWHGFRVPVPAGTPSNPAVPPARRVG